MLTQIAAAVFDEDYGENKFDPELKIAVICVIGMTAFLSEHIKNASNSEEVTTIISLATEGLAGRYNLDVKQLMQVAVEFSKRTLEHGPDSISRH